MTVEGHGPPRDIAVRLRDGAGPPVVWLGGFRSDMTATKASALDEWAEKTGRRFVRFDYGGHGASGGRFEECTISSWLDDARASGWCYISMVCHQGDLSSGLDCIRVVFHLRIHHTS